MSAPQRIAIWSGPRNISTALMRSFGSRDDSHVVDEPLYAFFLCESGADHPGREEILASQPNRWQDVAQELTGPVPGGAQVFYQKHMAHHLLPSVEKDWMVGLTHAFLIREPRAMLTSYSKKREHARLEDLGFPQQVALYKWLEAQGQAPPVIESRQVLDDPRKALGAFCAALDLDFQESMLTWKPGIHGTDGVWAGHWYDAVVKSTGFSPYQPKAVELTPELEAVAEQAEPCYQFLAARRIRI
ncbi:MAG: HAD family hydrolase [bacterium]|nr:HAD family hydrolase [bacterium]